jgi:hypothetical protein
VNRTVVVRITVSGGAGKRLKDRHEEESHRHGD